VMNERGAPTPVAWTRLRAPESLMGTADAAAMEASVKASPRYVKYAAVVDRDSAREMLAVKVEEGARRQAEEDAAKEREKAAKTASKTSSSRRTSGGSSRDDGGIVSDVVKSGAFKDFMRTAAREIARGMFGTARRR
jgi:hypothetical protein